MSSSTSTFWEGLFLNINYETIRNRLKQLDAKMLYPMGLYRIQVLNLPQIDEVKFTILDELPNKKTFLTLVSKDKEIEKMKGNSPQQLKYKPEHQIKVDDFDKTKLLLEASGFVPVRYRELKQEKWFFQDVEVSYNKYPGLEPFVKILITKKMNVDSVLKKFGLQQTNVLHQQVNRFYADMFKQNINTIDDIPEISFKNIFDLIKKMDGNPDIVKQQFGRNIRRRRSKTGKLLVNQ